MTPFEKAQAVAAAQEILGVAAHATEAELRRAWKKLAFEMHPDRGSGSSNDFANMNAAYNLLRTRSRQLYQDIATASPKPADQPARDEEAQARVHPRPVSASRVTQLTELVTARCRKALRQGDPTQADHVPDAIRRKGREIEYIVESPLAKGINRIALPLCDYRGSRRQTMRIITFNASDSGSGTFAMPEHLRRDLFPGARDVRIHFAKTGV